jgi:4-hydroxy-tetrahydrodipicolinate reductase
MKIALIGYGKMGKEIEAIAKHRNQTIELIIDVHNRDKVTTEDLKKCDVAIEFSTPHTAIENIYKCFDADLPVVVGTTGWYDRLQEVKDTCQKKNGGLFYATNFSIGVNLFFKLNETLAGLMKHQTDYEVSMEEHHHIHKKDAPSGTAITIAEGIFQHHPRKKKYSIDQPFDPEELHINVVREGEIPGTHIVKYHSSVDEITISHKAFNRKGFALGAVLAAEFMAGKKGIHGMNELLGFQ